MKKLLIILLAAVSIALSGCNVLQNIESKAKFGADKLSNGNNFYDLKVESVYDTTKFPTQVVDFESCFNWKSGSFYSYAEVDSTINREFLINYVLKATKQAYRELKRKK